MVYLPEAEDFLKTIEYFNKVLILDLSFRPIVEQKEGNNAD